MKMTLLKIMCMIILLCSLGYTQDSIKVSPNYSTLFKQFRNLQLQEKAAVVSNYKLARDVAEFMLKDGSIYQFKPIAGKECAMMFVGEGEFSFQPPTWVEQEQLYRFYEKKKLNQPFNILFIVFADSTLQQLNKNLVFKPHKYSESINSHVEDCIDFISDDDDEISLSYGMVKTLLEGEKNSMFYAYFCEDGDDPFVFEVNPLEIEEIKFLRTSPKGDYYETINQFHKKEDYKTYKYLEKEDKRTIDVLKYKIENTIDDGFDFSAHAEITFQAEKEDQKWLNFMLYHKLEIDSIFWDDGTALDYYRPEDNFNVFIHCRPALTKGKTYKLHIHYQGDLIDREAINWFYIKSSISWYPQNNFFDKAIFDLTFHTPEDYTLISVGENTLYYEENNRIHSHWLTKYPIRNASFNIGMFEEYEIDIDGIPPTSVYISEEGHFEMGQLLGHLAGIASGSDMEKQVAADVANSIAFYQDVFGPCPVSKLYVTEIPYSLSEAFPGLIHLSWSTFQRTDQWGRDEALRGHEVAHQWWGVGVDQETYHDQWLIEGFAEYGGLWYMQSILKDNEKFFYLLSRMKQNILENRKFLLSSGQEAGPIWLGIRNVSSETEEDFAIIVYEKGAWVLHMLRNLMLDLKTMSDEKFKNVMRDFYKTYLGKSARTRDFQAIIEKHLRKDMSWFFDQWVYGTGIPEYDFSWSSIPLANGQYRVHCQLFQTNVEESFQMYVPLRVDFGEKGEARLRILVSGKTQEFVLPLMPYEPEDIEFNYLESVLCEVND